MSVCTANTTGGKPCKAQAISGATVCRVHGGSAPQVIAAAKLRLAALVDPAIGVLSRMVKAKGKIGPMHLAAARDILDRAGLKAPDQHEITGSGGAPLSIKVVFVDPEPK